MQHLAFLVSQSATERIVSLLLVLSIMFGSSTSGQVSNPRIPAEWEEIQAVVMEGNLLWNDTSVSWENVFDPFIKTAQACIDENIDFYIYEYPEGCFVGDRRKGNNIHFDSLFQSKGLVSPNIHIITADKKNSDQFPWARDHGMFCVYKNTIEEMSMYHFKKDVTSQLVDSIYHLNSIEIEADSFSEKDVDGGNFMTDGHGSFNIMKQDTTEITTENYHFSKFLGIEKTVKLDLPFIHIDYYMKMVNEETIIVSHLPAGQEEVDSAIIYIKHNLRSAFGREFKIIPVQNAPDYIFGKYSNYSEIATYTNALIMNNTVLVPQYACGRFRPETDSLALAAYSKAMPGYKIVGVNSSQYQQSSGAIHCMTHEIPANNPIYIKHQWLADSIEYTSEDYNISALVQSSQGISTVKLFWKLDAGDSFTEQNMTLLKSDTYIASIPYQDIDTEIEYYITAIDSTKKNISKPYVADKGAYKSKIVTIGAITHPDSLYSQAFFPCLPDGSAIQQATIIINDTVILTNALTNDTITAIDLNPGKYSYTISSPHIIGEYHGIVSVSNRYPDTVKVIANPFEFIIKSQQGNTINDAEIVFPDYLSKIAPSTINYAFEGNYNYKVTHSATTDITSGAFSISKNTFGSNYIKHQQQKEVILNLYNFTIFPCLPDGTTAFATSIKINDTTLTSNPLTNDSIVNLLLPPSQYSYTITSPNIIGEYNGVLQTNGNDLDTINAIINPIKFFKEAEITINDSLYVANSSGCVYSFEGDYTYRATHPTMVDTAYRELIVIENAHSNNYISNIPQECDGFAQITILLDSLPFTGASFYKEKYPAMSYVSISNDGNVYFSNAGLYNYEVYDNDKSMIGNLQVELGVNDTINLMSFVLNSNSRDCYLTINGDTLSHNFYVRKYNIYLFSDRYNYNTFYKNNTFILPLDSGVVSPSNNTITQNIHVPYYSIESGQGAPLINAQLRTNLGNNVFSENEKTFDVVFKANETITCTVSCEGYKDTTFTAHNDDLPHTIQLVSGENSAYYTVTFLDHNDAELNIQTASEGSTAYAPNNPVRQGYTFTGWDVDFTNITDDITVTAQYSLDIITALENTEDSRLAIYPNPVENTLTIDFGNSTQLKTIKVSIIDLTGKTVYQGLNIGIENNQIDVSELEKGVYLINIGTEVRKIIKR